MSILLGWRKYLKQIYIVSERGLDRSRFLWLILDRWNSSNPNSPAICQATDASSSQKSVCYFLFKFLLVRSPISSREFDISRDSTTLSEYCFSDLYAAKSK